MDFAAKFEKNRRALLRMVCFWLVLARVVRIKITALPRSVARFVHAILFKAEASAGFLILCHHPRHQRLPGAQHHFVDAARRYHAGLGVPEANGTMTLDVALARLQALRIVLRSLASAARSNSTALFAVRARESVPKLIGFIFDGARHALGGVFHDVPVRLQPP